MKKMLPKILPCLAGASFLVSTAFSQTVHIDENFDNGFGNRWSVIRGEEPGNVTISDTDPDGMPNSSLWIQGGNVTGNVPSVQPSDANPVVWRVRLYDYAEEEPAGAPGVYAELRALHADHSWQSTLFVVGVFNWPYENYEIRMYPTHEWITLDAPRSEGWHTFTFVIRGDSFDVYVDEDPYQEGAVPHPDAHSLAWTPHSTSEGFVYFDSMHLGGSSSRAGQPFLFDDIYLASDPTLVPVFDITQHPEPLTVAVGDDAGFLVTVAGQITYQWHKDETDLTDGAGISGATTDALSISSVTFEDAGFYQVAVSDGTHTLNSRRVALTVEPFLFTGQPGNVVVEEGGDMTMNVAVHGEGPFTYQWRKDGVDLVDGGGISGATADTLVIAGVEMEDSGVYSVVVENAHGERTSSGASLAVTPLPTGVRFGDFEEFDAPSNNGAIMFREPDFSGSNRGVLGDPNTAQVVSSFPEGMWGARTLRVDFAFDPDFEPTAVDPYPWLRFTPHVASLPTTQILRNPIIGFDRYFVFDVHSNEDVYIALSVRESNNTGEYGETSAYTGDFQFIGGSADDPGEPGLPQKGVLVKAGSWQKVVFDMPNEFVKPGLSGGDDKLDGAKGMLESLAIRPFTDEEGNYPSVYEIYFDNFEVTEVKPVIVDPDAEGPTVTISRSATGEIELLIEGEPATEYTIESADNLGDSWASLGSEVTDASGNATFTDSAAGDAPRRFYRIVLP